MASGNDVVAAASRYLGVRYTYGGATPAQGFDCSGLVYKAFADLGIAVPRDTVGQLGAGTDPGGGHLPGDCVYFGNPSSGGVNQHVGIYTGGNLMVDAPHTGTVVRYDPIAGFGEPIIGWRRFWDTNTLLSTTAGLPTGGAAATQTGLSLPNPFGIPKDIQGFVTAFGKLLDGAYLIRFLEIVWGGAMMLAAVTLLVAVLGARNLDQVPAGQTINRGLGQMRGVGLAKLAA